jgi:hypothetical protein
MAQALGGGAGGASVGFRVEVVLDSEPISGRVVDDGGKVWSFHGWLDLIQVIEAQTSRPPAPSAEPARREEAR